MNVHRCAQVLLHPRTSAFAEATYAAHGLHGASGWGLALIYTLLLLVALAHLIWAHMEVSA